MKKKIMIGILLGIYMFIVMSVSIQISTPDSTAGKAKLGERFSNYEVESW